MEFVDQWPCTCLAYFASEAKRLAAGLAFDIVECADTLNGFGRNRRTVGHLDVVELTPDVRPAGSFDDFTALIKVMESGLAIGLQNARELAQMLPGMFTLAIFRVGEPHGWRCILTCRAIIAHIGPQSCHFR